MRRSLAILALVLAAPLAAHAGGPEEPPPPWFVVADIPAHDPAVTTTRWLWNREARALRYCRKPVDKDAYACAPDALLPNARWVLQRLQDAPEAGVASSIRFYSPEVDRTLTCRAAADGSMACE